MELLQFIPETLLILVVSLGILGVYLKKSNIKDKYIPSILLGVSLVSSCLLLQDFDITSILQGVVCWGIAIGVNQTFIVQPKK